VLTTVLFADIVGSTQLVVDLGDTAWALLLERYQALVHRHLERFRGQEIDSAGDGYFVSFDGPARSIRCGVSLSEAVRALGIDVRIGIHTGECELVGEKLGGIAVHIGARIAGLGGPGEVLVSSTLKEQRSNHKSSRSGGVGERSGLGLARLMAVYPSGRSDRCYSRAF
jgi:class 3 adenylate cyclase